MQAGRVQQIAFIGYFYNKDSQSLGMFYRSKRFKMFKNWGNLRSSLNI